jgi:hypothetical protein
MLKILINIKFKELTYILTVFLPKLADFIGKNKKFLSIISTIT